MQKKKSITKTFTKAFTSPKTTYEWIIFEISGKAPGPDGLSSQYYKCFEDKLLQPLKGIMNSILYGARMSHGKKPILLYCQRKVRMHFWQDKI